MGVFCIASGGMATLTARARRTKKGPEATRGRNHGYDRWKDFALRTRTPAAFHPACHLVVALGATGLRLRLGPPVGGVPFRARRPSRRVSGLGPARAGQIGRAHV